jgi:hypothetical protein
VFKVGSDYCTQRHQSFTVTKDCSALLQLLIYPRVASRHTPPAWLFQSAIGKPCTDVRRTPVLQRKYNYACKHVSPPLPLETREENCGRLTYTTNPPPPPNVSKGEKDCGTSGRSSTCAAANNMTYCTHAASNLHRCYMRPRHVGTVQSTQVSITPI